MEIILTDRSRYTCGTQQCQHRRYFQYHFQPHNPGQPIGISPKRNSLALWTGTGGHKGLEIVYKLAKEAGRVPEREAVREALKEPLKGLEEAARSGFQPEEDDDGNFYTPGEFTLLEQLALIKGITWGYYRVILPKILEQYSIEAVEEEFPIDISTHDSSGKPVTIRQQTRPDLVLRGKNDGRLSVHDFKSSSYKITKSFVNEYRTSPQMSSSCLAVSKHYGEPVQSYTIHALLKGGRKAFSKKGFPATSPRQYSSFCYAKFRPANPPLQEASYDLTGYWYDKSPVWMDIEAEDWVYLLSEADLYEQFALVGPYDSSEFLGQQFLKSLEGEELAWKDKLAAVRAGGDIDKLISRSYKCFDFGSKCPYYDICMKISNDLDGFTPRVPHHPEELERFNGVK